MNNQPIEKRRTHDGAFLEVHSIFKTIQGEGPFAGHSSIFIRLAGCNLKCPACDTDYTSTRENKSVSQIVSDVQTLQVPPTIVVITGGEPFRQNIEGLVYKLLSFGYTVQIETNGTLPPPSIHFDKLCSTDFTERGKCFVVCSPKTGSVHPALARIVGAYKYVMDSDHVAADGLPTTVLEHPCSASHVARPHPGFTGHVYVQPCDSKDIAVNHRNVQSCVDSVYKHGTILQLQIHKIIGVE